MNDMTLFRWEQPGPDRVGQTSFPKIASVALIKRSVGTEVTRRRRRSWIKWVAQDAIGTFT